MPIPSQKEYDLAKPFGSRPELGSNFADRLRVNDERIRINRLRPFEDADSWGQFSGLYSDRFFGHQETAPFEHDVSENLAGKEVVIDDFIRSALELGQKEKLGRPLIIVDFGGMLGLTWCKLAYRYRDEIKAGKVRFIVTGLNLDNARLEENFSLVIKKVPKKIREVLERGRHLVDYLRADAPELLLKTIKVDGVDLELEKNTDLIFEEQAMQHGSVPDRDLPLLGSMLSPIGAFFFTSDNFYSGGGVEREELADDIKSAWKDGLKKLRSKLQPVVDTTSNHFFVKDARLSTIVKPEYPTLIPLDKRT